MEHVYIVLAADLNGMAGHYETEDKAREVAQTLCERRGKPFIVAKVIARIQVKRFPTEWVELGNDEPDTSE